LHLFTQRLGWIILFLALVMQIPELNGLRCYQCLSTDCSGNKDMCNSIRSFLTKELKVFYQHGNNLEVCPEPNNLKEWRQKELDTPKCNSRDKDATCSLGRIRVTDIVGFVTHATIVGCASVKLLDRLKKRTKICADDKFIGDEGPNRHSLEIEHCFLESDHCTWDYCVAPHLSVVKSYQPKDGGRYFEKGWVIAIIVVVVLLFVIVLMADFWRMPFNWFANYYPVRSNFPNANNNNEMGSNPPLVINLNTK